MYHYLWMYYSFGKVYTDSRGYASPYKDIYSLKPKVNYDLASAIWRVAGSDIGK